VRISSRHLWPCRSRSARSSPQQLVIVLSGAGPHRPALVDIFARGDFGGVGGHPIVRLRRNFYEIECKSTSFKLDFYQHPVVHNSTSERKDWVLLAGLAAHRGGFGVCWCRRNGAPAAEFFGNECVSGPFCIRFMNQMHREILYMCDASERSLACRRYGIMQIRRYDTRQDCVSHNIYTCVLSVMSGRNINV